ncbi:MAG: SRPBCC domain-containing protein [Burkholderiaceae bacterium]|nr:SRPBCC domain-containing protein [Burkholderiaceae bacterium]
MPFQLSAERIVRYLETQIDIDAQPGDVWSVLVDFARYPEWNPFVLRAEGLLQEGALLDIVMRPWQQPPAPYRVRLTSIRAPHHLGWLGHFKVPGLIDGDHSFALEELPSGATRLRQDERFGGLLVPFVWRSFIQRYLALSFEALNQNLKARCEGRPLPVPIT